LNRTHFEKYNWFVCFNKSNGVFCKYCVLFSNKCGKDRVTQLNKLVKEPLNKYAKVLRKDGDFEEHRKINIILILSGLALLLLHRSINIDIDRTIDQFSQMKKRNIDFII
jgi:hypothetical protein